MRTFICSMLTMLLLFCMSQTQAGKLKAIEQDISDAVITTKITALFTKNKNLNPLKISVSTDNGLVTLKGFAGTHEAFVKALRIAVNTRGVKGVNVNDLHIKQVNTYFTDALITARVETAVLKAKVLDDETIPLAGINAQTINGIVTLMGTVNSARSAGFIIQRVSKVPGVKKIVTLLKILESS